LKKYSFKLKNLSCPNCANKIQIKISENGNFKNVSVNFNTSKLTYESENEDRKFIEKIIKEVEPDIEIIEKDAHENKSKSKFQIIRLIIGIAIGMTGFFAGVTDVAKVIFVISGYLILLYRTILNTVKLLRVSRTINENFLITISCIGAYLIGEHIEGFMVIVLYEIGKILEEKAVHNTRQSISKLMDIKPEYANLKKENNIQKVLPKEVEIGDIIVIKQGEKVPLDGVVISGVAELNVSSLTGETKLKNVNMNDSVLSGSINVNGVLEIKVTERYENSTVNKILELVENATDKKAKTETFVARAARIYTPIVLSLALLVGVFTPLIFGITYSESIYRALVFLVISCPCAIAISVPLSYFSGIGKASKDGILIKGSNFLDSLKDVTEIVFDKTGTLTNGSFEIKKVNSYNEKYSEDKVLECVVLGESFSNHPIAKSILENVDIKVDNAKVQNYKEITGSGISYEIEGKLVFVGNNNLVKNELQSEETEIFVSVGGELAGSIVLTDTVKHDAKQAINKIHSLGIKTKMFTGDTKGIAMNIAEKLEISEVKYEMLPTDKYLQMEEILKEYNETGKKVAFVGDGINDAPVLALADVGISMGGVGSSSAIEASDVVIMTDKLEKIFDAIKISKKTYSIIKQNLIFAIGVKVSVLILSTFGITGMWQAIFADVGVTLIAILNTLRILR